MHCSIIHRTLKRSSLQAALIFHDCISSHSRSNTQVSPFNSLTNCKSDGCDCNLKASWNWKHNVMIIYTAASRLQLNWFSSNEKSKFNFISLWPTLLVHRFSIRDQSEWWESELNSRTWDMKNESWKTHICWKRRHASHSAASTFVWRNCIFIFSDLFPLSVKFCETTARA